MKRGRRPCRCYANAGQGGCLLERSRRSCRPWRRRWLPTAQPRASRRRAASDTTHLCERILGSGWGVQLTPLQGGAFSEHCSDFAQSKGAALVEVARGLWGALIKYLNAVHGLELDSPFAKLAAVGLMPERAQPRARVLQERDLPAWRAALDKLGERQRDFLLLTLYTGLRRNECRELQRQQIDLAKGVLSVLETKNGKPHSLPITPMMAEILQRRCDGLEPGDEHRRFRQPGRPCVMPWPAMTCRRTCFGDNGGCSSAPSCRPRPAASCNVTWRPLTFHRPTLC